MASAVQEASGAYRKHSDRRNKLEPKPKPGAPPMPDTVAEDERARFYWDDLSSLLSEMKVLTTADEVLLAGLCLDLSLRDRLKTALNAEGTTVETNYGPRSNPKFQQHDSVCRRIARAIPELGLSPSSRTRLHVTTETESDPFTEWLKGDN